jgi:hypothetical protein
MVRAKIYLMEPEIIFLNFAFLIEFADEEQRKVKMEKVV